jgi:catechol 2,3-dioxygenase-like lactoylglutathione lyase family enzyme
MKKPRLVNCAAVLVTPDIRKAVDWYRDKLGFRVTENFDQPEPFAALYRDSIELILIQSKFGKFESNRARYGAGYDVYLAPEKPADVDLIQSELAARGVKIVQPHVLTSYGSRELVFEDVDGRLIGVGCIEEEAVFRGER